MVLSLASLIFGVILHDPSNALFDEFSKSYAISKRDFISLKSGLRLGFSKKHFVIKSVIGLGQYFGAGRRIPNVRSYRSVLMSIPKIYNKLYIV